MPGTHFPVQIAICDNQETAWQSLVSLISECLIMQERMISLINFHIKGFQLIDLYLIGTVAYHIMY